MRAASGAAGGILNGRPEKHEFVFESLARDEDLLYNGTWRSEHSAPQKKDNQPQGGVMLTEGAIDNEKEETEKEEVSFLETYRDRWVCPVGAKAEWMLEGQFGADAEELRAKGAAAAGEEEDEVEQPPQVASLNEEVLLWRQDWAEESDEDELLEAHDRLHVYADVFGEGKYMEVGRELRKNPKVFRDEKTEVLSRVLLAAKEHLEFKKGGGGGSAGGGAAATVTLPTEPTAAAATDRSASPSPQQAGGGAGAKKEHGKVADGAGLDQTVVTLGNPCRQAFSLKCCSFLCGMDSNVHIAKLDADNKKNKWSLPEKHANGMLLDLKGVEVGLTPVKWRWQWKTCLCCECCCDCRDQGTSEVAVRGDVAADIELSLHPAASERIPLSFRKAKLGLRTVDAQTQAGGCSCRKPFTPPRCLYPCMLCCFSPCIKCAIEREVKTLPKIFGPPPVQKMA